jgi:hypothetical protein
VSPENKTKETGGPTNTDYARRTQRSAVQRVKCKDNIKRDTKETRSCNVRPCHQVMACPRDADGEDGLKIRTVAANILN